MKRLKIQNLGPIKDADVEFGDLTILIGPQASGKSVFLQALKLCVDSRSIYHHLKQIGFVVDKRAPDAMLLEHFFGIGMSGIWKDNTSVDLDNRSLKLSNLRKVNNKESSPQLFYIPAQRILATAEGRFRSHIEFDNTTPYVLRDFSETLRKFSLHGLGGSEVLFPIKNRLKEGLKQSFNKSIFYNGEVVFKERDGQRKLSLKLNEMNIPFMSWSAGQKEFMPLLMAFYCLTGPPNSMINKDDYKYVVLEEPEMGLHPKATVSVLLEILELLKTGKKVVISTHSTTLLDFAWAFNLLKERPSAVSSETDVLAEMFDVKGFTGVESTFKGIFKKSIKTYFFDRSDSDGVTVSDISSLDAWSDDPNVSEWGGISSFPTRMSDLLNKYQ